MGSASSWQVLNRPRTLDTGQIRAVSLVFLMLYGGISLRRPADHMEFVIIRFAVCSIAAAGVARGHRFTWPAFRAYTVLIAFTLSLGTAYINGTLGNGIKDLPLTALATFVPLVFLQAGWDFALVVGGLLIGNAALLCLLPPPSVPLATVVLVLGSAIVCGTVSGITLLLFRVRLDESLRGLEQALGAKNEFLNTMSHELRSPLHVIIGYADILRDDPEAPPPPFVGAGIRASALELLQLVENTMNVARLDAGKVRLYVDEFAPAEVVGELAESVRALPEAKGGVPVRWQVSPDLPRVRLDRLKLKEIVQNLVSNALKFTDEGVVWVAVDCDAEHLRIAVRDTGRGIPPESQERIFELFERVDGLHGGEAPGVGLGLYIVKSLVELMRGRIDVTSDPGHGACFTVRLPLALPA
jgi:signal transduction histidine kinase